jgi:hypothetical protein
MLMSRLLILLTPFFQGGYSTINPVRAPLCPPNPFVDMVLPASTTLGSVRISNAGVASVRGLYRPRPFTVVPTGFAKVCNAMNWPATETWHKLAVADMPWWEHEHNCSYLYFHVDGTCWLDEPSGNGVYIAPYDTLDSVPSCTLVPTQGWTPLGQAPLPLPTIELVQQ